MTNKKILWVSALMFFLFLVINISASTIVSECQDISEGGVYVLNQSVNSSDTCFTINASNVELDCNGSIVNYSQSGISGYGIYMDSAISNVTVKNCFFEIGTIVGSLLHGIMLETSTTQSDLTIYNNTFNLRSATNYAMNLQRFTSSNISNNNITTGSNAGIYVSGTSQNNDFYYNTLRGGDGFYIGYYSGIFTYQNNFVENTIYVDEYNNDKAFYIDDATSCSFINNKVILESNDSEGFYIHQGTSNVNITGNTINMTGEDGSAIMIYQGSQSSTNTFSNNTINYISGSGNMDLTSLSGGWLMGNYKFSDQKISNYNLDKVWENNLTMIFENSSAGKIMFLEYINGSGTNLFGNDTSDIIIRTNFSSVDATKLSLNKSAEITFYNMPIWDNINIIRNGNQICNSGTNPSCNLITTILSSTLEFNVSSWSNYSLNGTEAGFNVTQCRVLTDAGVYTQTADITASATEDCIQIVGSDIIYDGNGYSISNPSSSKTAVVVGVSGSEGSLKNITIKNTNITMKSAGYSAKGINVYGVNETTLDNNTIHDTYIGINFYSSIFRLSHNATITNNNIINTAGNTGYGLYLQDYLNDVTIKGNNITTNTATPSDSVAFVGTIHLYLSSYDYPFHGNNIITTDNYINGKIWYYNESISNYEYNPTSAPTAGMVTCVNCNNINVTDMDFGVSRSEGIQFFNVTGGLISNYTSNYQKTGIVGTETSYINIEDIMINFTTTAVDTRDFDYSNWTNIYIENYYNNLLQGDYIRVDGAIIRDPQYSYGWSFTSDNSTINNITMLAPDFEDDILSINFANYNNISNINISNEGSIPFFGTFPMKLYDSNNNSFTNLTSEACRGLVADGDALIIRSSSDNMFNNFVSTSACDEGVVLNYDSDNNIFIDGNWSGKDRNDTALYNAGVTTTNYFHNCSFDDYFIDEKETFYRYWYLDVQLNNTQGGIISGVNTKGYNATGTLMDTETSDSTGIARLDLISLFVTKGTTLSYSNYTINVSKENWINNSGSINMTGGNKVLQIYMIDDLEPVVTIDHPRAQFYPTNNSLELNYSINDSGVGVDSCWYSVLNSTGDYEISNTSLPSCANVTFNVSDEQTFTLHLYANDSDGNVGNSSVQFAVSTSLPSVALESPESLSWLNYADNIYFNFTPTDSDGVDTCELWENWTGSWNKNYTWINPTNATMNYTIFNLTDGYYKWNVWCNDTKSYENWGLNNFTFGIDTVYPLVDIKRIATTKGSQTITFYYNITEINPDNCFYSIYDSSGNVVGLNNNVSISCTGTSRSATVTAYGTYNLTLCSRDSALNLNCTTSPFVTEQLINENGGGIVVIDGKLYQTLLTTNFSITTSSLENRLDLVLAKDSVRPRSKKFILTNRAKDPLEIKLICENTNTSNDVKLIDICNYVSFENDILTVSANEDSPTVGTVYINTPDDAEFSDKYTFNILAVNIEDNQTASYSKLSVTARVPIWGLIFKYSYFPFQEGDKLNRSSYPVLAVALVSGFIIFAMVFLILRRKFPLTGFLIGFVIFVTTILLLLNYL